MPNIRRQGTTGKKRQQEKMKSCSAANEGKRTMSSRQPSRHA